MMSVQTNEFRRVAESRLCVAFGGRVPDHQIGGEELQQGCSDSTVPHIFPRNVRNTNPK